VFLSCWAHYTHIRDIHNIRFVAPILANISHWLPLFSFCSFHGCVLFSHYPITISSKNLKIYSHRMLIRTQTTQTHTTRAHPLDKTDKHRRQLVRTQSHTVRSARTLTCTHADTHSQIYTHTYTHRWQAFFLLTSSGFDLAAGSAGGAGSRRDWQ